MFLKKWEELPEQFKTEAVRPYYDILCKKKCSLFFKRVFDIVASFILLIIISPVMLMLSVWIKLDSPGPVMFRQNRVTTYGKVFRIYKFRTMVNDADKKGTLVTTKADNRITKVGAKLRDLRLDELPQLINVLLGEMSFAGTRPEVEKYVAAYSEEMYATLLLPAGITSRTSIEYKDEAQLLQNCEDPDRTYIEEILPEKMEINLKSVKNFSFWEDIKTLFATVAAVFK